MLFVWTNFNIPFTQGCLIEFGLVVPIRTNFKKSLIQFIFTILPPILGEQGYSLVTTWIPFTQGCLVPSFLKWNHILFQQRSKNTLTPFQKFKLRGSDEEVKNVKSLQQQWITDKSGSENLTWSFDSDELMNRIIVKSISYAFDHWVTWADMQYDMDFSM